MYEVRIIEGEPPSVAVKLVLQQSPPSDKRGLLSHGSLFDARGVCMVREITSHRAALLILRLDEFH